MLIQREVKELVSDGCAYIDHLVIPFGFDEFESKLFRELLLNVYFWVNHLLLHLYPSVWSESAVSF